MAKAGAAAQRAQLFEAQVPAEEVEVQGALLESSKPGKTKLFRVSLDLNRGAHDQLLRWLADTGHKMERRVPASVVLRELLGQLYEDEDLQAVIIDRLGRALR
jgi:hypothetical protein